MRHSLKAASIVSVSALALAACGSSDSGSDADATSGGGSDQLMVGMAFDTGGRGDGTFNDMAVTGLDKAKSDLGAQIKELSPKDDGSDRADLLRSLADDGYNPIIGVGYAYEEAMDTVAGEYPDVQFVRVDGAPSDVKNVAVQTFAEQEGSFLVGAAAALKSKSGSVGFIGGNESDLINKFGAGFKQGAEAVNSKIKVLDKRLAPGEDPAGFGNTAGAKTAAQSMYDDGADVIYTAAGGSFGGSFPVAKSEKKWAIGVDSDQYNTVDPQLRDVILTSMVKRVDTSVFEAINTFKDKGSIESTEYGLKSDGVGYSTSGGKIDDIKSQLEDYKKKIIDGEITVAAS